MENKKVKAMMIFEMIGRPVEHLTDTMNKLIEAVSAEKGVTLINKKVHEAKKIKQDEKDEKEIRFEGNPELFSTFCEIEIETPTIMGIFSIAFRYMPSHMEIIQPETFDMTNNEMGFVVNEILLKLHNYDSIAKSAIMQNQMLARKLNGIFEKYPEEAKDISEINVSQKLDYESSEKEKKKKKR